jgi:hypothetical protein
MFQEDGNDVYTIAVGASRRRCSLGLVAKIGEKIMNARILPAHRSCMRQYLAKCSIESPKRLGPRVVQTKAAGTGGRA